MKYKATYMRVGSYSPAFKYLIEKGMGIEYEVTPPLTKHTLEIGSKYSPDYVCAPFKYILGNYIEALETGTNLLLQTGGVCRLGYYGELQERILKDLGYDFKFINVAAINIKNPVGLFLQFKEINPDLSILQLIKVVPIAFKMVEYIDELEFFLRQNIGFEVEEGSFERVFNEFSTALPEVQTMKELKLLYKLYRRKMEHLPVNKPAKPLRVGLVGEFYTVQEPFANHGMEKALAKMNMVVYRQMNLSCTVLHYQGKQAKKHIKDYCKFDMGATAMFTVAEALEYAKAGFDGIIHVKSFGCMPEIDVMPVLQNISQDYGIPILYFSFDSQTSETGIQTRLEAFNDMIAARNAR